MASNDTLHVIVPAHNLSPTWLWVAFTSGSTEPSLGATIYGSTSSADAILEYLVVVGGTWGGGNASGYMLLSNWDGSVWTSGENFNTTSEGSSDDHGTLTGTPTNCFATPDKIDDVLVLDFDDTVNEVAIFPVFMPRHYGGGGVTLTFGVMATTATTGDMSWSAFFMSITDNVDNLRTKNFAAPQSNTAVDAPTAVGNVRYFTISFSDGIQMDSIDEGEFCLLLLMRDAQDGTNDDMIGDAELVFIEIKEM